MDKKIFVYPFKHTIKYRQVAGAPAFEQPPLLERAIDKRNGLDHAALSLIQQLMQAVPALGSEQVQIFQFSLLNEFHHFHETSIRMIDRRLQVFHYGLVIPPDLLTNRMRGQPEFLHDFPAR